MALSSIGPKRTAYYGTFTLILLLAGAVAGLATVLERRAHELLEVSQHDLDPDDKTTSHASASASRLRGKHHHHDAGP
jgi:hypothetical protein